MHTRRSRIYLVPGSMGLAVPASTAAGPGVTAIVPFAFPRSVFVTGILALPRSDAFGSPLPVIAAGLGLTLTDENVEALISDGRGTQLPATGGGLVPSGAGLLMLHGRGFRPWPLQRPIAAQDVWRMQIQNAVAVVATMAGIYLYAEVCS